MLRLAFADDDEEDDEEEDEGSDMEADNDDADIIDDAGPLFSLRGYAGDDLLEQIELQQLMSGGGELNHIYCQLFLYKD